MGSVLLITLGLLFLISFCYGMYNVDGWEITFSLNFMNTPYYKIGLISSRMVVHTENEESFIRDEISIGLLIIEIDFIFYKDFEG